MLWSFYLWCICDVIVYVFMVFVWCHGLCLSLPSGYHCVWYICVFIVHLFMVYMWCYGPSIYGVCVMLLFMYLCYMCDVNVPNFMVYVYCLQLLSDLLLSQVSSRTPQQPHDDEQSPDFGFSNADPEPELSIGQVKHEVVSPASLLGSDKDSNSPESSMSAENFSNGVDLCHQQQASPVLQATNSAPKQTDYVNKQSVSDVNSGESCQSQPQQLGNCTVQPEMPHLQHHETSCNLNVKTSVVPNDNVANQLKTFVNHHPTTTHNMLSLVQSLSSTANSHCPTQPIADIAPTLVAQLQKSAVLPRSLSQPPPLHQNNTIAPVSHAMTSDHGHSGGMDQEAWQRVVQIPPPKRHHSLDSSTVPTGIHATSKSVADLLIKTSSCKSVAATGTPSSVSSSAPVTNVMAATETNHPQTPETTSSQVPEITSLINTSPVVTAPQPVHSQEQLKQLQHQMLLQHHLQIQYQLQQKQCNNMLNPINGQTIPAMHNPPTGMVLPCSLPQASTPILTIPPKCETSGQTTSNVMCTSSNQSEITNNLVFSMSHDTPQMPTSSSSLTTHSPIPSSKPDNPLPLGEHIIPTLKTPDIPRQPTTTCSSLGSVSTETSLEGQQQLQQSPKPTPLITSITPMTPPPPSTPSRPFFPIITSHSPRPGTPPRLTMPIHYRIPVPPTSLQSKSPLTSSHVLPTPPPFPFVASPLPAGHPPNVPGMPLHLMMPPPATSHPIHQSPQPHTYTFPPPHPPPTFQEATKRLPPLIPVPDVTSCELALLASLEKAQENLSSPSSSPQLLADCRPSSPKSPTLQGEAKPSDSTKKIMMALTEKIKRNQKQKVPCEIDHKVSFDEIADLIKKSVCQGNAGEVEITESNIAALSNEMPPTTINFTPAVTTVPSPVSQPTTPQPQGTPPPWIRQLQPPSSPIRSPQNLLPVSSPHYRHPLPIPAPIPMMPRQISPCFPQTTIAIQSPVYTPIPDTTVAAPVVFKPTMASAPNTSSFVSVIPQQYTVAVANNLQPESQTHISAKYSTAHPRLPVPTSHIMTAMSGHVAPLRPPDPRIIVPPSAPSSNHVPNIPLSSPVGLSTPMITANTSQPSALPVPTTVIVPMPVLPQQRPSIAPLQQTAFQVTVTQPTHVIQPTHAVAALPPAIVPPQNVPISSVAPTASVVPLMTTCPLPPEHPDFPIQYLNGQARPPGVQPASRPATLPVAVSYREPPVTSTLVPQTLPPMTRISPLASRLDPPVGTVAPVCSTVTTVSASSVSCVSDDIKPSVSFAFNNGIHAPPSSTLSGLPPHSAGVTGIAAVPPVQYLPITRSVVPPFNASVTTSTTTLPSSLEVDHLKTEPSQTPVVVIAPQPQCSTPTARVPSMPSVSGSLPGAVPVAAPAPNYDLKSPDSGFSDNADPEATALVSLHYSHVLSTICSFFLLFQPFNRPSWCIKWSFCISE